MKIKHYLLTAITALTLAGCYDDDKLWNAVDEQEQRLETLEQWQKQVNSNIEALQTLVSGQDYITEVTPITQGGETIGYTIAFHTHAPITLYHGEKGDKGDQGEQGNKGDKGDAGSTPIVSVTKGEDGNWYWTLNGELLKDADGKLLRANGIDGTDGRPGADGAPGAPGTNGQSAPTPQLKTGEALNADGIGGDWIPDAFYLSVDGGKTWDKVSGDNGTNGDSWFADIDTENEDYVTFTLAGDGSTTIQVPRYKALTLAFTYKPEGDREATTFDPADVLIVDGKGVMTCIINGSGITADNVRIYAAHTASTGWTADVDPEAKTITLSTTANNLGKTDLLITATDNAGRYCTYQLALQTPYDGGRGTKDEPYTISTAAGLEYLAKQVNEKKEGYENKFLKLTQNIDLKEKDWTPIGAEGRTRFKGTFDGGGKRISGLKINSNSSFVGLFGIVDRGATLQNITLVKPSVETIEANCGPLAGFFFGNKIENCHVEEGTCTASIGVGGLVGIIGSTCEVTNCRIDRMTLTAREENQSSSVGGLVGTITSDFADITVTITQCCATNCTINAQEEGCGGLIGDCPKCILKLYGCYASGTITGDGKSLGGLIGEFGWSDNTKVIAMHGCYSECTLINKSGTLELSLVGTIRSTATPESQANYYLTDKREGSTNTPIAQEFKANIDQAMIDAMNSAVKAKNGNEPYNADGTFK